MTSMVPDPLDLFLLGAHPVFRPKQADPQVPPYSWSLFTGQPILNPASNCHHQPAALVKGAVPTPLDRPLVRLH